jgi:AcrR family transcriptional regulator
MSSTNSSTRILDAALALIIRRKGADVSMAEIAAAARVSRQGVYLHFADRAALMLALVRHAHEEYGVAEEIRKIGEAPTGVEAMREWVSLQPRLNPSIWSAARALEIVRRTDAAAERGWQDRLKHRLATCRKIVARMHKEGTLKPGVTQDAAAELLWSVTSLHVWENLVLDRGWTPAQYKQRMTRLLRDALTIDPM